MERALQILSISALIAAGVVLVLDVDRLLSYNPETEQSDQLPIVDRFLQAGGGYGRVSQKIESPLIKEAKTLALYLTPPRSPGAKKTPARPHSTSRNTSTSQLLEITPKFRVLATCYYRSKPEESMALVSEPGNEARWVKQGVLLGRFFIEKINKETIVYRHGDRLGEMAVEATDSTHADQTQQTTLASGDAGITSSRTTPPSGRDMRTRRGLNTFGISPPRSR